MVSQVIDLCGTAFAQCWVWFQSIVDAVGGKFFIVSAFVMVAVASLVVYPIRGSGFNSTSTGDFIQGAASFRPGRHWNGKFASSNIGKHGKFERIRGVRGNRAGGSK